MNAARNATGSGARSTLESGPEQLDLLDWLAEQEPGPATAASASGPAACLGNATAGGEPRPLRLTRLDPGCNMRRFYSLALAQSLWGEWGVARQWGRIGSPGQSRTDWHASPEAARAELERMAGRKRRRGYREL